MALYIWMKTVGLYKRTVHFCLQLQGVFSYVCLGEDGPLPRQKCAVANRLSPDAL